jgi:transcriptional regulator with XRE-family HTH domain
LTLREVAGQADLSMSYLSEIEKGKKYPKPEKLMGLAEALGTPFDELVSLKVADELGPLKAAVGSPFLTGFPFDLFGFDQKQLVSLVSTDPVKAGALVRAFLDIGRSYDVQVEHFLLAALRSYQQMNGNYFEELEQAARTFREERSWPSVRHSELASILEADWGYRIDRRTLSQDPTLSAFRSVFRVGPPPTLYLNDRLLPSQQAFVLAREIGYQQLGLGARANSSSWLKVESFEQVLNNFKASYFAGALLLDQETLRQDLSELFRRDHWSQEAVSELLSRYQTTPETLLTRLTQLVPRLFGLDEIYFVRFNSRSGTDHYQLSKILNMSRVPVPHGIGLREHYCRRWPAIGLLAETGDLSTLPDQAVVRAQRSYFLEQKADFFVLSMARRLALTPSVWSGVSVGFLLNDRFKSTVAFWDDPAISRLDVNLTCERCGLEAEECAERAAERGIFDQQKRLADRERALENLLTHD